MSFSDLTNATFTVETYTESGNDDGTPVYTSTPSTKRGWFDEQQMVALNVVDRGMGVQVIERRALVLVDEANLLSREQEILVVMDGPGGPGTGPDLGRWRVDIVRSVPDPVGNSHWEIVASKMQEGG